MRLLPFLDNVREMPNSGAVGSAFEVLKVAFKQLTPLSMRQRLQPRQFQLYGLGTARSGTTSLFNLFYDKYRAAHEAGHPRLLELIERVERGLGSEAEVSQFLIAHNRQFWLELDSSCFLALRANQLVRLFPEARFVITLRDCYTWLDSILNNHLEYPRSASEDLRRYHDVLIRPTEYPHCRHDRALEPHGLHSIDAYLAYWERTNNELLLQLPKERRLVIRTHEIREKLNDIARLVNIDPATLTEKSGHANRSDAKRMLALVDRDYVLERVEARCATLMNEWFPDATVPERIFEPLP